MKRNGSIKIIAECIIVLLVLIILIHGSSGILMKKGSQQKFQEFYEQEQNFDVLFFGSSHVNSGIVPMDMWEQDGIVGYSMSTSGSRLATLYWVMRNSLEYTTPELVVIDVSYLRDEKVNPNTSYNHVAFDTMPLNKLKIEAILDLYEEKNDILRYLLPFTLYHNRWEDLTGEDFQKRVQRGMMGANIATDVTPTELAQLVAEEATAVNNVSTEYLDKIVELCRSRDIDVLFTYIPFWPNDVSRNDAAYLHILAEQYGVHYLDPNQLAEYINPATDYTDSIENNSHLNISGAHKISYFLSDYIVKNYDIKDRRSDLEYADWNTYYQLYRANILSSLRAQNELDSYLMHVADRNFSCVIRVNDHRLLQDETIVNLLGNLGGVGADVAAGMYITVNWPDTATLGEEENGSIFIYNNEVKTCEWDVSEVNKGIQILVMDRVSMQMLHSAEF